jgi:PAS domain-containing protein
MDWKLGASGESLWAQEIRATPVRWIGYEDADAPDRRCRPPEKEVRVTEDPSDVLAEATGASDLTRAEEIRLRYAAIVECSDDAIIAKTLDGVISAWNAAAERCSDTRSTRPSDNRSP